MNWFKIPRSICKDIDDTNRKFFGIQIWMMTDLSIYSYNSLGQDLPKCVRVLGIRKRQRTIMLPILQKRVGRFLLSQVESESMIRTGIAETNG